MNIKIWDNGGETLDRYTIGIKDYRDSITHYFGMSKEATGYDQFVGDSRDGIKEGTHLGKRVKFSDVSKGVQTAIFDRISQ